MADEAQSTHGYLPTQFLDAVLEGPAEQERLNRTLRRPNKTPSAKTQTDGTLRPATKPSRFGSLSHTVLPKRHAEHLLRTSQFNVLLAPHRLIYCRR